MNAKLRIPKSQQLRFVNKTYYQTTPITLDTRLFKDFTFQNRMNLTFCQKIEQTDSLIVFFRTSYPDFILTLYKVDSIPYTETAYNGSEVLLNSYTDTDGDTIYQYNVPITLTSLSGTYQFEIKGYVTDMPEISFWSEPFQVKAEWDNTQLVKFGGNESISDGMRWGEASYVIDYWQYLRVDSRIAEVNYGMDLNNYVDSDSELTALNNYPKATHIWDLRRIPYWMVEKIKLALQHDYFEIDGTQYAIEDDFELDLWKAQLMNSGMIPLRVVEYENYTTDEVLVGDNPVIPPGYVSIDGTDIILINATDGLLKS